MDINLQQLRMLREVAELGTIAAAAQSLGYTSSAVSQQLNGLEKATSVAVLERVGRNVRLTDAGRELVVHAESLLRGLESAQAAMERVVNEARGEIRLSVYESVASTLLVPVLTRLAADHPQLRLRTREIEPDRAIDAVANGDTDLALGLDYPVAPMPPRRDLVRFDLADDPYRLVVPHDDPLPGPRVALSEVAERPFITSPTSGSCGRCELAVCHQAGFEPDIVHQLDDFSITLTLVAAGHGVAIVPELALGDVPAGVRTIELDRPWSRRIQLIHRTASAERPAVLAVRNALAAEVAAFTARTGRLRPLAP